MARLSVASGFKEPVRNAAVSFFRINASWENHSQMAEIFLRGYKIKKLTNGSVEYGNQRLKTTTGCQKGLFRFQLLCNVFEPYNEVYI